MVLNLSVQFKTQIEGKNIFILNNELFYADTDIVIRNQDFIKKLTFTQYNKIAYIDMDIETTEFKILRLVVCKTRINIYVCNVIGKLKETNFENLEEIYGKILEEIDKVIR
ncbi:hypothetical protein [Sulfolobus acidocaldarius]|uniref:Uncharacterized protein n=2 Tax=Sulfolobus acidocaldarius TaxID=2285 RepID=A0A0U3GJP1_9CREN|nr:hypothetical protein [Sulfolobus acidocaldarius]AGE73630.1 hypothetical protein SacRon12I_06975 [Sulfolobus acidocaldarius Ron12/I]ALU30389.1 hypothetical protein ATY89_10850 [Sulfolobus acidocaldarius]ALU31110.1 hypothetical protein ATZ20_02405 [Sulfolobus acidocaldarius]